MRKNPSLIIAAGKGCFTCCKGCYQYFGKTLASTNDLLEFIKKYKHEFNLESITLAGGDPMTRKDIVYLVDELYNMNLEIHMDTTGKNFIKDSKIVFQDSGIAKYINPEVLKDKITKIGIAFDGYNNAQINHFRKFITIEEIKQILKKLNSLNFRICINTVVNKANINDLEKIYEELKYYKNIIQWQLFQYSPIGDLGFKNRDLYEIEENEFVEKINLLIEKVRNSHIEIEGKSNSYRKLNYILVNSDGEVWQPRYDLSNSEFKNSDKSSDKYIIGTIYDIDIIEKIKSHFKNVNENITNINSSKIKVLKKRCI